MFIKTGRFKRNWWDCSLRRISADACNRTGTLGRYFSSILDVITAVGPDVQVFWQWNARSYSPVPTFLQRYPLKWWSIKTINIVEIHKILSVLSHSSCLPSGYPQVQVILGGFVHSGAEQTQWPFAFWRLDHRSYGSSFATVPMASLLSLTHRFVVSCTSVRVSTHIKYRTFVFCLS